MNIKKWIAISTLLTAATASANGSDAWSYNSKADALSDQEYSFTYSKPVNYKYNDNFSIGFHCQNGKVRFEISAGTLIQSKNKPFSFAYRVDKKSPSAIQMKTFSNDGLGGYTFDQAKKVANDLLGGSSIFVRAVTWNNEYLETTIPLTASDQNIKKVFADCGSSIEPSQMASESGYTFEQFEQDFKKLSVKKQQALLKKVERLVNSK